MITTEIISINSKEYLKTTSDKGYLIKKVGTEEIYSEAIDSLDSEYVYEETEDLIDSQDKP